MKSLLIGAHTSAAGGSFNGLVHGQSIGANTVQIFTSNQKQWKPRTIPEDEIQKWNALKRETGINVVMSHDSYLINLGSVDPQLLDKSQQAFLEEIKRCHLLNIDYLNFHPGAYTKGAEEQCLEQIAKSLIACEKEVLKGQTLLLLEATAGQGTTVGYKFSHLGSIIKAVHKYIPIGVCIDTCHIFAAGYDIRTPNGWEKTLKAFDEEVGLKYLKALHLNDSIKPLGSRVDRHASIGQGEIGKEAFRYIVNHPDLSILPMYLETPNPEIWAEEIHLLRSMVTK
jgi:deoxyribonuclease-4